jgi:hypothetical protein
MYKPSHWPEHYYDAWTMTPTHHEGQVGLSDAQVNVTTATMFIGIFFVLKWFFDPDDDDLPHKLWRGPKRVIQWPGKAASKLAYELSGEAYRIK